MLEPDHDCPLCPRLVAFRAAARGKIPGGFNAPVPTFGDLSRARLVVVGLAPGLQGANKTGRPFTGDYAGELLYPALTAHGFARGTFRARVDDGVTMVDAVITNAVRCVPPENKPTGTEVATCRRFLASTLAGAPGAAVLCLGRIAHDAVLRTLGARLAAHPFGHGAHHEVAGRLVADSYHPSRYNVNTNVITAAMFEAVVAALRARIGPAPAF